MPKKPALIGAAALAAVVIGVSIYYPPADSDNAVGSIGKVDKYRDSSSDATSLRLQNDFKENPEEAKLVLETMDFYGNYLSAFSEEVDSCKQAIEELKVLSSGEDTVLKQVEDLSIFIDNNLETVHETQVLLKKYAEGEEVSDSEDIENRLIQFGDFAANLQKKEQALDKVYASIDGMIDREVVLAENATLDAQTESLVNVRERLLGMLCMHASVMGNVERLNMYCNAETLNFFTLNSELNAFAARAAAKADGSQLGVFRSQDTLNLMINAEAINMYLGKTLEIGKFSKAELGILNGKTLGPFFNMKKMGFKQIKAGPFAVVRASEQLGSLSNGSLGGCWSKANLGSVASFSSRMNAMFSF